MDGIKKAALGVLLAGLAFGFSAFTTLKKRSIVVYYKTNMSYPVANDPRGYKYYLGDRCESTGDLCSAQWNLGTNPPPTIDGQALPLIGVTFQTSSVIPGHFE